jgi:hypothetical protein
MYRRMVEGDTALGHHLLKIPQAEIVSQIPPGAEQDHGLIELPALEHLASPSPADAGHSPITGKKELRQNRPMRCYLQLVNSHESIPDDTGIEVSDLAKAEEVALQAIEDIREEATQQGASWQGWRLDIVDRSGRVLLSIPLDPTLH